MYIKSQFVDYYDDVALATGDPELKYIRNQTEKRVEAKRERRATLAGYSDRHEFKELWLGFCGKVYPIVWAEFLKDKRAIDRKFHYNIDSLITAVNKHGQGIEIDRSAATRFFLTNTVLNTDLSTFFERFDTPIFVVRCDPWNANLTVTVNARLVDIEFQTQIPPDKVHEEISGWFCNRLQEV